jgi:3-oxoacyl-[acyl-carrier-protein] synthase II
MFKRVVITGMGAITPIGKTTDEFWTNAKKGVNGINDITLFDTTDYKVTIAAEVKDFDVEEYIDKKEARRMDRYNQFAIIAADEAMEDSKIDVEDIDNDRFGVIIGSGVGGLITTQAEHEKLLSKGPKRVSPFMIPMLISNMAAGSVAIKYNAKGHCTCVVTACASGTHAIGEAFKKIKYGEQDIMLAGGAEASVTQLSVAGFTVITALSTKNDPERASIPFDKERDGFVVGEGAGILILEELEHAKKRGAKIYGEVVGYGATCDAYHITQPAPMGEGAAKAMEIAIKEGNISPNEVSYINAHGTSTPYNDKFETQAIKAILKDHAYNIPINSTKSMTGHLLGAAGAIESIICIKSMVDSYVHPTIGYRVKDEECDLDYVPNTGRNANINYALSNSLGFGGHNASLLFKKWEDK